VLADDVAAAVATTPGLTAAEIAVALDSRAEARQERAVSAALFANHGRFRCDRGSPPRWWPAESAGGLSESRVRGSGVGGASNAAHERSAALQLRSWQSDALDAWSRSGHRGVVEAVTGTGKTMVGVAATLDELTRRSQVLVLVPTVELQRQWAVELRNRLPAAARIGRLGAGGIDSLGTHDVLVAIVNSARAVDVRPIRRGGLLVADECHRYGSAINRLALDERFARRLGLSATYAREDDGNLSWLDPYFGGTCFRMGYRRALADDVTAHFAVALVGVRLADDERQRYGDLTLTMARLRARLAAFSDIPAEPFEAFMRALNMLAETNGDGGALARGYRAAMLDRRRLLADTPAKEAALAGLAPAIGAADRAIVFTQSIAASERACAVLGGAGLRAGAVSSAVAAPARHDLLRRFEAGDLDVISAPRVLDEGIDVPAADLAVIAGASRSRRQMIQRMGRVLRRKPDARRARFAILCVEETIEDPRLGAHGAFLDEVVDVADHVEWFGSVAVSIDASGVCDYLARSATTQPLTVGRY
jgi:superfamily II DNA or RNA helicase